MSTWKMQSVQSRLRGGGGGHALGSQSQSLNGGGGMMMGGGMMPQLTRHYSIQMQQ